MKWFSEQESIALSLTAEMNNVYCACTECKTYVDAGYRWAYWRLEEPKIVLQGAVIEVNRLLSVNSYWRSKHIRFKE